MSDILTKIIDKRKNDISRLGLDFGIKIPEKRERKITPFLKNKGLILEVKRASPSKGDIALNLDSGKTALEYAKNGAVAISCLTEQNYFKGSLQDLMNVCQSADEFEKLSGKIAPAVLRKDFLLYEEEIEISYRAGADAVLLIARILTDEIFLKMAKKVVQFGMSALIEVRSEDDLQKIARIFSDSELKNLTGENGNFVFGVNSRDLATFKIDLLRPCMMMEKIKKACDTNPRIIFESGVTTSSCASAIGATGFHGILLGEAAAKNPEIAGRFVQAFSNAHETKNSDFWKDYAISLGKKDGKKCEIKICGLTRIEDAKLAENLGATFTGFVFASAFKRSVTHNGRLEKILAEIKNLRTKKVAVIVDDDSPEAKKAIELVKDGTFDLLQFHKIPYEKISSELLELPHYFATDNMKDYETLVSNGEMRILLDLHKSSNVQDISESDFRLKLKNTTYEAKWLAGGITPDNKNQINDEFHCELIDVSGGVEDGEVGIKSEEKMRRLFDE